MADVVAFVDDLLFQSKIAETARHAGVELKFVASPDSLAAESAQSPAALVIVDLNARNAPLEAIQRLKAAGAPQRIIAFLSHVQVELAAQARASGCTEVLPRSKFTQLLPEMMQRAKAAKG